MRTVPQSDIRVRRRGPHRDHVASPLRVDPADERVARDAEAAARGSPRFKHPERPQGRRMQTLFRASAPPATPCRRVPGYRPGTDRARAAARSGSSPIAPPHSVQLLGPIVVWRERFVVDRPRRRHAVGVRQRLEILAAQPVEHAAPELGVAADVVVRVGLELAPRFVEPRSASGSADPSRPRRRSSSRLPAGRNRRARGSGCARRSAPARAPSCRRRRRCR
jgi:hypothetical protein